MKPFGERNPFTIGLIGIVALIAIILVALNYQRLPLLNQDKSYTADFAEAG
jgi:phospholipid/cholesterol/gamma-HCH transport system substrate-binding protein